MALSRVRASCFVAAVLGSLAARAAGPQLDSTAPIHLDAHSSSIDYKNNSGVFNAVKITQGAFSIEADRAEGVGLDFKAGHWVFHGNVKITMPDGSIASDEARIEFADSTIATAQITGTPAVFEQRRDKRLARGKAAHIDYDVKAQTVRLSDGATLSDGEHDISARTLIYDMRGQKLRANPDDQQGSEVHLVIDPKKPGAKLEVEPKPEVKPEAKPNP